MRQAVLRLGVVGMGRGFMLTLPALRAAPRLRLAGAFDPRAEARDAFTRDFDAPAFDNLDAMLSSPEIDAVYIASPHALHARQTVAALDAAKHVLVEKPMATTIYDGVAMVGAARRANRALMVGPSHGYDAQILRAAELLRMNRFGLVRHVTALNYTDFMYRPRRPEELADPITGGVVFSQAAHQIDVVRRLVGVPLASVRAVAGDWDRARPGVGAYSALATFAGGATAAMTYSGYAHYDSDELVGWISELGQRKDPAGYGEARRRLAALEPAEEAAAKLGRTYGGGGTSPAAPHQEHFGFVVVSCEGADLKLLPTGIVVYADEGRHVEVLAPPATPRTGIIDAFVDAAIGSPACLPDGSDGLETIAFCQALLDSARRGADVSVPDLLASSIRNP